MRRTKPAIALFSLLISACGDGGTGGPVDVTVPEVVFTCPALSVSPSPARVATGGSLTLRASGGSGTALFALDGTSDGATIEPGGGLRAGPRAAMFTAVARDGVCGLEARVEVQVVGPFAVQPLMTRVAPGGTVRFTATGNLGAVQYSVLSGPMGAGAAGSVTAEGVFTAGTVEGNYELVARDEGSERSVRLTVDVGAGTALAPRSAVVMVPAGERAPIAFRGGSGSFDFAVSGAAGGRVVEEGGQFYFDATMARAGSADVMVTDRFTSERASVRVLVGETLGVAPAPRGTQTTTGDMASGDVNGDGRTDLIVGHSERSAAGIEAGGVLVYYGDAAGGFAERPSLVIEGARARDRFGSVLLVADTNADGVDDVLVGSPDQDLGDADRGTVTLYLGSRDGLQTAQPERVLLGEDGGHRFGTAFVLHDVNGDNAVDLVVSATGAVNPTARTCLGGRVYVYRNRGGRGVFETIPWQTLDLRDSLTDDAEAFVPCANSQLTAGRSLALIDIDSDGRVDLAAGAPQESHAMGTTGGQSHGAVVIYRGGAGGIFERTPAWSIHLEPSLRASNMNFGFGLDVVRPSAMGAPVLVVRSPSFAPRDPMNATRTLANAGGLWVFAQGSLPAPAAPAANMGVMQPRIRTVTTELARGRYYGAAANRGVGRQGLVLDVDGDNADDYVVAASTSGAPGSVLWFSLGAITMPAATLAPAGELAYAVTGAMPPTPAELQAYRVAPLRAPMAMPGRGLALWAAWRTTMQGPFVGAIDVVPAAAGPVAPRFAARASSLTLQGFGSSDRAGSTVALGALAARGTVDTLVGSPGTHSPANGMAAAGARLRTGAVERFAANEATASARAWVDRQDAQLGGGPVIALDFDGDGVDEVAVADANESQAATLPATVVNPSNCGAVNAMGALASVSGRGVVRVYAFRGGQFVERFRAVSPREMPSGMSGTSPTFRLNRFGAALGRADVNGDGMADLVVGRTGGGDSNGAEVVLGRRYDDAMNRVVLVCNTGDAVAVAASAPTENVVHGLAVAGVGDLDRDGCDETAYSISRYGNNGTLARAGVLLAYGYGPRCMGHDEPFTLRIVADDRSLDDNVAGASAARANDDQDLPNVNGSMGRVFALGAGDFTGDGVPDLVYRTADLGFRGLRGPAVEVLSGAFLAGLCPNRACPSGRTGSLWADGDYRVLGVRTLDAAARRVIPAPVSIAARFGAAMALADLGGDPASELVIGSPDDPAAGPFAGLVRVYRGGTMSASQDALLGDPWMVAVGDVAERGEVGAAVAASPRGAVSGGAGWVLVGAPASGRHGVGGEVGAAFRFRAEVP